MSGVTSPKFEIEGTPPKRMLRLVAGACLINGFTLLLLALGCLPTFVKMQHSRDRPMMLTAVSVNDFVALAGSILLVYGILAFQFFLFSVLLWKAKNKIPE